ncbi:VOC family protein [Leptospira neocaledonica]|uniref:Glyoxalase n=1 Tax=Leptospira neocaledonica TaxID=2023192 RepID=A0A2M9ZUY3_9LEPT|nr:VOC family protein [Leptospira neocaledonica]PJZ75877.1 glyoxalase [Leptospira neocaledonica]
MNQTSLKVVEIKTFLPAKNFEISKQFYEEIGFTKRSDSDGVAYFCVDNSSFLLQDFYNQELAENLMMHLLVEDVRAWYKNLKSKNIEEKFQVKLTEPEERPWRMIDFVLIDPSGVLWRIGQNI